MQHNDERLASPACFWPFCSLAIFVPYLLFHTSIGKTRLYMVTPCLLQGFHLSLTKTLLEMWTLISQNITQNQDVHSKNEKWHARTSRVHSLSLILTSMVLVLVLIVTFCVFTVAEVEKEPVIQAEGKGKYFFQIYSRPSSSLTELLFMF